MMNNFLGTNKATTVDVLKSARLMLAMLLLSAGNVYAEDWFGLTEKPEGKIAHPPKQLEEYPLGENTEKHFPPNMEFTLWAQDESQFKPKEDDRVEIK